VVVAQPHRDVLLGAGADVAEVQRGVYGGVDEVAAVARELNVGYGPLGALGLHCLDWAEATALQATEGEEGYAAKVVDVLLRRSGVWLN
jgi:hypothetical protein